MPNQMSELDKEYWVKLAKELLAMHVQDVHLIDRYATPFAYKLRDYVEEYVTEDIPSMERDSDDAAQDAYWDQKIDEEREGK